jgi:hypothetical protein
MFKLPNMRGVQKKAGAFAPAFFVVRNHLFFAVRAESAFYGTTY